MTIRQLDPTTSSGWDEIVRELPSSTPFHSSYWFRVIQESYGYLPYCLVLEEPEGRVNAVFPSFLVHGLFARRRLISLPFTDFCRPLIQRDANMHAVSLVLAEELRRVGILYAEFRGELPGEMENALSIESCVHHAAFTLDLSKGSDRIWERLKTRSVRMIRRAEKEGITVSIETSTEAMNEFCRLNRLTRRRHGIPPQPERFFRSLYQHVISAGHGTIFVARLGSTAIAASVFLFDDQTMYYKYSASDERITERGHNHLIFWRAIEWAVGHGLRNLDFGRTELSNEGLLMFKRGWGAEETAVPYSYWPRFYGANRVSQDGLAYRIGKRLVRRMPLFLLQIAGNLIYRFFG